MPRMAALERIHVQPDESIGVRRSDLLDVHSTLRGEDEQRLLRAAIEREREVVLARDVGGLLDPDLRDDMAADVHSEDLGGARFRLVGRVCELDASGLPAATDQHLGLDDDGQTELLGGLTGLGGIQRETTVGDRNPEATEQILALVLVQVQSARESIASIGTGRAPCASISRL